MNRINGRTQWLIVVILALLCGYVMALTSGNYASPNAQDGKYAMLADGASDQTGDSITAGGRPAHSLHVAITNTATVTFQCKAGSTIGWVTENTRTASGSDAYPLLDCDKVRAVISGCSACTVSVRWVGRNR
jgi:hypothetical protein